MLKQSQKLSNGLIIFSVMLSDFERLDFKNDALAGVRANYFNSRNLPQRDKTEIELDSQTYNLSYVLQSDTPLSWKVTRNHQPYQSVKRLTDGVYSVIYYSDSGIIYKRIYFDSAHNWIRTEYSDTSISDRLICRIYPETICKISVIKVEKIGDNGKKIEKTLYPSKKNNGKKCDALIYSNVGMLWYDESFKPQDMPADEEQAKPEGGFMFSNEQFKASYRPLGTFDITQAQYLESSEPDDAGSQNADDEPQSYSAYDKIENILTEAQKSNKDLFGEIINQTAGVDYSQNSVEENKEDIPAPTEQADNHTEDKITEDNLISENQDTALPDEETNDDKFFDIGENPKCDAVIVTKSGRYTYYGQLDSENCRTGRGRTVTPDGFTSYDGEYRDDMRDGFGVYYYKDGSINYVGSWQNNNRHGGGAGYRQSDGTMHVGKWNCNVPNGYGARFTKDGELIDVCMYTDGARSGKSVSFDENGNVVISVYENGEKKSETVIECEGDDERH